jgi:uncharacterized membrane protein YgcG
MTDHVARLYAIALGVVIFFLTWAVVAARPWAAEATAKDPRLVALERREERLRRESIRVQRVVQRRFAVYRRELRARQAQIAAIEASNASASASTSSTDGISSSGAAGGSSSGGPSGPSVSVVSLPPVTSSGSS